MNLGGRELAMNHYKLPVVFKKNQIFGTVNLGGREIAMNHYKLPVVLTKCEICEP